MPAADAWASSCSRRRAATRARKRSRSFSALTLFRALRAKWGCRAKGWPKPHSGQQVDGTRRLWRSRQQQEQQQRQAAGRHATWPARCIPSLRAQLTQPPRSTTRNAARPAQHPHLGALLVLKARPQLRQRVVAHAPVLGKRVVVVALVQRQDLLQGGAQRRAARSAVAAAAAAATRPERRRAQIDTVGSHCFPASCRA